MRFFITNIKMTEIYEGIKFNYKNKGKTITDYDLLPILKYYCRIFDEKKLAPPYPGGSSGNLSIRTKTGKTTFLITASKTALKANMPDSDFCEFVSYNKKNNTVKGKGIKQPSSESIMHYFIYETRPEINAIFHGHSPEILKKARKFNIPITEKEYPYGTIEIAKEVLKLIKNNNFVILKNHGFISCGKTPEEAGNKVFEILNLCKNAE